MPPASIRKALSIQSGDKLAAYAIGAIVDLVTEVEVRRDSDDDAFIAWAVDACVSW